MSIKEMESKVRELRELKRMAEDLDSEITAIEDALKAAAGDSEQVFAGERLPIRPLQRPESILRRLKRLTPILQRCTLSQTPTGVFR